MNRLDVSSILVKALEVSGTSSEQKQIFQRPFPDSTQEDYYYISREWINSVIRMTDGGELS